MSYDLEARGDKLSEADISHLGFHNARVGNLCRKRLNSLEFSAGKIRFDSGQNAFL
jgi:hypothetical protein